MDSPIPLVDLKAQYRAIQPEIDAAIQRILDSTSFIMGPDVATFEEAFARYCGVEHCIGISSGTASLELALRAFEIGPGHEVITVAHTFIATAEAISAVGATPVFIDIDPHTYTMDPTQLAAAITPATKAVIPVHIYGQPADMTQINLIAKAHQLVVIEDAAQAHGATWQGDMAGNLADAACFSFYPGKNLGAYGDAGAVTTNHEQVATQIRSLRNHGRQSKYVHEQKGFGERLDTLQAAVLSTKLAHLDQWTNARRRLAQRYNERLQDCELVLPYVADDANPAWHLYVVRAHPNGQLRDQLLSTLKEQGIGAGIHYPLPLHLQPAYVDLGHQRGAFPVTELVADTCLSLPLFPEMTDAQQDRVVVAVQQFMGSASA